MATAKDILGPVLGPGEPETRAAMVMTLFGAFGRRGTSGDLGDELDAAFLRELRDWADVVLVSATTAAAENYSPSETPVALLTRSLDVDPSLGVFKGRDPLIVCPEQSLIDVTLAPRRTALEAAGVRCVSAGSGSAPEVIAALHREGFRRIACEGGPSVYAEMIGHDLLDVCHVTLDPSVSSADGPWGLERIADQPAFSRLYALEETFTSDEGGAPCLSLRYRSVRQG